MVDGGGGSLCRGWVAKFNDTTRKGVPTHTEEYAFGPQFKDTVKDTVLHAVYWYADTESRYQYRLEPSGVHK